MKRLIILIFVFAAASICARAQTVQCQTTNGAWGPCQFVSPVATAQAPNSKISSVAGTTITNPFGSTTTAGNSILCIAFESAAAVPVISDSQTNTYVVVSSSLTFPGYTISLASNIMGGSTDTITETTSLGSAAFSCYELKGTVSAGQVWDYTAAQQGSSMAITFPTQTAAMPNEMVFVGVGMGGGTVNFVPSIAGVPAALTTVDQSNTTPVGGANLSVFVSAHTSVTNVPTFVQSISLSATETYSAVLVAVKPISLNETFGPLSSGSNVIGALTANQSVNVNQMAGSAISVAATGVQKVGMVGNTGSTVDTSASQNQSPPTNMLLAGALYNSAPTAITSGNSSPLMQDTQGSLYVNTEGRKQTYRMTATGFTPIASATSPTISIQGSSTKTIRITHIYISWYCTTGAALPGIVRLQKYSALTGGTVGSTLTGALNDSNNAAQTAVAVTYSAVPTTATTIGGVSNASVIEWITGAAGGNVGFPFIDWTFGTANGQSLVLRSTGQYYGLSVSAVGTTPVMNVMIEWTEE